MVTATPADAQLHELLSGARTIAVVGASPRPYRASHQIMAFLKARGICCFPVNPNARGQKILGQVAVGRLADLSSPVDIVDVFRNSAVAGGAVDDAIAEAARLAIRCVWLQLDVRDDDAMERAARAGLIAIQNRCIAIEYSRLIGR